MAEIPSRLSAFSIIEPFTGANNSTQYTLVLGYESLLDSHVDSIQIEVGLREPVLDSTGKGMAATVLLNPLNNSALVDPFPVTCLSYREVKLFEGVFIEPSSNLIKKTLKSIK